MGDYVGEEFVERFGRRGGIWGGSGGGEVGTGGGCGEFGVFDEFNNVFVVVVEEVVLLGFLVVGILFLLVTTALLGWLDFEFLETFFNKTRIRFRMSWEFFSLSFFSGSLTIHDFIQRIRRVNELQA